MSDFINTIDLLGDDVVVDSIIDRSITEFKDDKITKVGSYAFYGCTLLEEIDIPNIDNYANTGVGSNAFESCSALVRVNLPSWSDTTSATTYIFRNCRALEYIKLPSLKKMSIGMFQGCSSLKTADLPVNAAVSGGGFAGCSSFTTLILRNTETVCSLANTNNAIATTLIASGNGYVYVPAALIEDYKVATNWSTYATQFRALEDYTVDGTTTGELDESKI